MNLAQMASKQAREYFQEGRPRDGWHYLEGMAMTPHGAIPAHAEMARICLAGGLTNLASQHIAVALDTDPKGSAEAFIALAQFHSRYGNFTAALEALEKAKLADPEYSRIYPVWSDCCRELGRLDEALLTARKAVELDASDASAHFALAMALGEKLQLKESVDAALETLRLAPEHLLSYAHIGSLCRATGQIELAIRLLEFGVGLCPMYLPLRHMLVEMYLERQEPDHALRHALEVSLFDWTPRTAQVVAMCAEMAGKAGLAEQALLASLQGNPDNWVTRMLLGELYLDNGAPELAEPEFRKALNVNGNAWRPMTGLGEALIATNRVAEGERLLQAAIDLAPEQSLPVLRLAQRQAASGRGPEAMILAYRAFENASENHVLQEEAAALLQQLSTQGGTTAN